MYTVYMFDEVVVDDVIVFQGTLEECQEFVAEDAYPEELYIVEPDGFTVVE